MDYLEVSASIGKVPEDLKQLSSRVHSILGRLQTLKSQVSVREAQANSHTPSYDVNQVRHELKRAKETIAHFKAILVTASGETTTKSRTAVSSVTPESIRLGSKFDDKSKPLIDRIGGEILLETLVEISYTRFIGDSRLRAFFDLNPRKSTAIKKRLLQFLIGYLGGKSTYDESNLKPAHYHLNVTDYHLDAFLEIIRGVLEVDLRCNPSAIQDLISALSKVRKDIVTGYTIRCEVARINTERGIEILFRKLGGLDGVVKFIDRLYDVIAVDNRIRRFFSGSNFESIKRGQRAFITGLVGGPILYQGRSLEDIHRSLGIDDYYFDCYLQDAEKALSWLGTEESVIDQVLVQLESVRAAVLGRGRGVAQIIGEAHQDMLMHSSNITPYGSVYGGSSSIAAAGSPQSMSTNDKYFSNTSETVLTGSPLIVQLGGEEKVTASVDVFFRASIDDPRLRFFFLIASTREATFKRAIVNVILTIAGASPARYDLTQLRASHFDVNITDYHFDTWLSNLAESCNLVGMPAGPVRELIARMSKLRGEITGGCTIRLEMAQQRTESTTASTGPPMCASLGGTDGIKRVIAKLYELMLADPRVSMFFRGSKLDGIMKSQGQYLANLLGAHETYMGRDIHKVHALLNVSDFHFDCFLECFSKAVLECGFTQDAADECTVLVETHRRTVVNMATRNYSVPLSFKSLKKALEEFGLDKLAQTLIRRAMKADASSDKGIGLRFLLEANQTSIETLERKLEKLIELILLVSVDPQFSDHLKRAHLDLLSVSHLISDSHVDEILSLIEDELRDICSKSHVAVEHLGFFMTECRALRGWATCNYRIRRHGVLNRLTQSPTGDRSYIDRMGGEDCLADWLSQALYQAAKDSRLALFLSTDSAKLQMRNLISAVVRGPLVSLACPDELQIGISEYHFDVLANHLARTAPQTVANEIEIILNEFLRNVLVPAKSMRKRDGLLARMGGEPMLEHLVDATMDRLTGWTPSGMLCKSFFDIPKSRLRTFKRRITRYIVGILGGGQPVAPTFGVNAERFGANISGMSGSGASSGQYELHAIGSSYIRQVHAHMNISDTQFDAFIDCFRESCRESGLPSEAQKEFLAVLASLRSEVIIGWVVRSSEARERADQARDGKYESFFDQMGGASTDPGLEGFLGRVYELVERDKRINEFFLGAKFNAIREAQGRFLLSILGGPLVVTRHLVEVHKIYRITDYHFDCFVGDVILAARDCGAPEEVRDDLACILEPFRSVVVIGSRSPVG